MLTSLPSQQIHEAAEPWSAARICGAAFIVIVPLVAAAWLPAGFPFLLRQVLLCLWGVGAILAAERLLFSGTMTEALRTVGFKSVTPRMLALTLVACVPMCVFVPLVTSLTGTAPALRSDWLALFAGVILVNGITEEAIHRGFVFARLRRGRSFAFAATLSAAVFAAQHLYIIPTNGLTVGIASVVLAALLSWPMALAFERGGNSIVGPAVLHTSANAPVLVLAMPEGVTPGILVAHMGVILASSWMLFLAERPSSNQ